MPRTRRDAGVLPSGYEPEQLNVCHDRCRRLERRVSRERARGRFFPIRNGLPRVAEGFQRPKSQPRHAGEPFRSRKLDSGALEVASSQPDWISADSRRHRADLRRLRVYPRRHRVHPRRLRADPRRLRAGQISFQSTRQDFEPARLDFSVLEETSSAPAETSSGPGMTSSAPDWNSARPF